MRGWLKRQRPGVSDRTHRNDGYMLMARVALGNGDEPEFTYLVGKKDAGRTVILTELGKFDDRETIRKLAADICRVKMKTAEAVERLRQLRATAKTATVAELAHNLALCFDKWMIREGATLELGLEAVERLRQVVETMIERKQTDAI